MKEIKLRAWDKENKRIINAIFVGLGKVYGMTKTFKPSKELEDVILMEYTGLQDKTGRDIFEGDVVKWINHPELPPIIVEYNNDDASFYLGNWYERDFPDTSKEALIIGNIYENPELLDNK